MSRIESFNKVREYPDENGPYTTLTVSNHWNFRDRVVVQIGTDRPYIFLAEDLIKAIRNAQNCHEGS